MFITNVFNYNKQFRKADGAGEYRVQEDIWTKEKGRSRRLEIITQWKAL
jgi:hypothetical protein